MAKKKTELTEEERSEIKSQIRTLQSRLDAPTSNIGDWKIIKIYEARLRDEINALQTQLEQSSKGE